MQVETVAQFGVIFLLFALGLEFSTTKVCLWFNLLLIDLLFTFSCLLIIRMAIYLQLRVVRAVAVLGGLLQIFLFMCLSGITATVSQSFRKQYFVYTTTRSILSWLDVDP